MVLLLYHRSRLSMSTTAEFVVVYVVKHSTVENSCSCSRSSTLCTAQEMERLCYLYSTKGRIVAFMVS